MSWLGSRPEEARASSNLFPAALLRPWHLPAAAWSGLSVLSVVTTCGLCGLLVASPKLGLFLFWRLIFPLLPLVFLIAPDFWRHMCPISAINRFPQTFGFSRGLKRSQRLIQGSYAVAVGAFLITIALRKALFNTSSLALALLIVGAIILAFIDGLLFHMEPGGHSMVSPLLPLQRLYGPTIFSAHADPLYQRYHKVFAGVLPGFILAYHLTPNPPATTGTLIFVQFAIYSLASLGAFVTLSTLVSVATDKLTTFYAAAALILFYWFNTLLLADAVGLLTGIPIPPWAVWLARLMIGMAAILWLVQVWHGTTPATPQASERLPDAIAGPGTNPITVRRPRQHVQNIIIPESRRVVVEPESAFLELGDRNAAQAQDPISISLTLEPPQVRPIDRFGHAQRTSAPPRVVIIGSGIAGATAADSIRRYHRMFKLRVVEQSPHQRAGSVSALPAHEPSVVDGVQVQTKLWSEVQQIPGWVNTSAVCINPEDREVVLGTGETVPYDRLILATGATRHPPAIPGFDLGGTFLLDHADDTLVQRAFAYDPRSHHIVIADGDLPGLAACAAIALPGLRIFLLTESPQLLHRWLDARSSDLVQAYLRERGVEVLAQTAVSAVLGTERVQQVLLHDGSTLPCDLFFARADVTPNVMLARTAGLRINRGVIVDDQLCTSVPEILAAGDVAEHRGQTCHPWPAAVEQAHIAAINAMGGKLAYAGTAPIITLNLAGLELTVLGRTEPEAEDLVIALEDGQKFWYRKLVISRGTIVGAVLLGHPLDVSRVRAAIKQRVDVRPRLDALRAGDWGVLSTMI